MCVHSCNYYPDPERALPAPTRPHEEALTLVSGRIISNPSESVPQSSMWNSLLETQGQELAHQIYTYTHKEDLLFTPWLGLWDSGTLSINPQVPRDCGEN